MSYSQAGQDIWVLSKIKRGFFIDIGAYDGVQTSNTYLLEQHGWQGICIEANLEMFKLLEKNRSSVNVHAAVTDHKGIINFGIDKIGEGIEVPCDTLNNILTDNNCPKEIDYLSIDIEGHELTVFSCFDFSKWDIKLMTVEHNLYLDGPAKKYALYELLTKNGFTRVAEDVKCLDTNPLYFNQPYEDWYENSIYHT